MNANDFAQFGQGNFYLLLPRGVHAGHDDGTVTNVTDASIESVLAEFTPGRDLLIDEAHNSLVAEKSSMAMGWITSIEANESGVWGRIFWSDVGMEAILGGRYRFLSPVCAVQNLGDGIVMPLAIESCALTNVPALDLPPLITFDEDDSDAVENRELICNRGNADVASQRIAETWCETSDGAQFNNWVELCRMLSLDPLQSDDDDVKIALNKRQHRGTRSTLHGPHSKLFRNRGSSIRGTHTPESVHKPESRLKWGMWGSGFPQFEQHDTERSHQLNQMADRLCKNKSVRAIRQLANQYQSDFFMRSALSERADLRDEEERAKREHFSNRTRKTFRPLGSPETKLIQRS